MSRLLLVQGNNITRKGASWGTKGIEVLGLVGAGGLGQRIHIAITLFLENQLLTFLIFIYALVTLVDYLSAYLRRRII
ncbi:MAG TPA: hypothetical protein VGK77_25500 [Candidatus Binatia bacterium]